MLSEHVQDDAPEGYYLEIDPPDRVADVELHEGVALQSWGTEQLYSAISIGLRKDLDQEFEENVEGVITPKLEQRGAVGRTSRVNLLFEYEVVVMVRFAEMAGRTVGDLIGLADDVRALLLAVRSGRVDDTVALGLVLGGRGGALMGRPEANG